MKPKQPAGQESRHSAEAGQAVYSQRTLAAYDWVVLGLSNRWIWRCPTPRLLKHYNQHLSANHLDVGVGTGYFLDRAKYPGDEIRRRLRVVLMDMNEYSLAYAARRVSRLGPEEYQQNILEPISHDLASFDSIGINYLIHCLPGTLTTKAILFEHLCPLLTPDGTLFGSTLLHQGVSRGWTARRLMAFYNAKGIFSNQSDSLAGLRAVLERYFQRVSIDVEGAVALFSARRPIP